MPKASVKPRRKVGEVQLGTRKPKGTPPSKETIAALTSIREPVESLVEPIVDQQPGETHDQYQLFVRFCKLVPIARSVRELTRVIEESSTEQSKKLQRLTSKTDTSLYNRLCNVYFHWRWKERAAAWDMRSIEQMKADTEAGLRNLARDTVAVLAEMASDVRAAWTHESDSPTTNEKLRKIEARSVAMLRGESPISAIISGLAALSKVKDDAPAPVQGPQVSIQIHESATRQAIAIKPDPESKAHEGGNVVHEMPVIDVSAL